MTAVLVKPYRRSPSRHGGTAAIAAAVGKTTAQNTDLRSKSHAAILDHVTHNDHIAFERDPDVRGPTHALRP